MSFQEQRPGDTSSEWLVSLLLPSGCDRDAVMARMTLAGIETRPVFYPAHHMPMYRQERADLHIAEDIAARGISLPSFPAITEREQNRVAEAVERSVTLVEAMMCRAGGRFDRIMIIGTACGRTS